MKIVFMGTSDFAVPALRLIIESDEEVVGIVTRPDRPKGRGRKLVGPPIKHLVKDKGIKLFQPVHVKDESFISELRKLTPDVIAVVSFGRILSRSILAIPSLGCVNLHASLLPEYRGAAPINWAIMNGDSVTGVTTILMDEGMDTGDILLQWKEKIEDNDTAGSLHNRLAKRGADLLLETLQRLNKEDVSPFPQNNSKATMARMLKKEDGLIDWRKESTRISNQVRGLTPWPGTFTYLHGKMLKVLKSTAQEGETNNFIPGTIVSTGEKSIKVSTGQGFLLIEEVQLQDHKRMEVSDFLRGHGRKIKTGTILGIKVNDDATL